MSANPDILEKLKRNPALLAALETCGRARSAVLGCVVGCGAAVAAAAAAERFSPAVLVAAEPTRQERLTRDCEALGVSAVMLPQLIREAPRHVNAALQRDRMRVLANQSREVMVATPEALEQPAPAPESLARSRLELRAAQELAPEKLVERLSEAGYEECDPVEAPGQFARRGGIVDVYPRDAVRPVRVEFFGETVESLRRFSVETQLSETVVEAVEVSLLDAEALVESTALAHLGGDAILLVEGETPLPKAAERLRLLRLLAGPTGGLDTRWEPAPRVGPAIAAVMERVREVVERFGAATVFFAKQAEADRFSEMLRDAGLDGKRIERRVGRLSSGLIDAEVGVAILAHDELFARHPLPPEWAAGRTPETGEPEMEPGAYCVHTDHGICRFMGMRRRRGEETFEFAFADGERLYLAPLQLAKVHRYMGAGRGRVRLSKVGGGEWRRRRERVRKALTDLARELIRTQAERLAHRGTAYPPDSAWQREFEAAFPYEETPDQLRVVSETKRDMESPRPTDRLVAGDVGYGKTEVAMRAAFKAVEFGRQAAVLVPTTVLAEQHYRTFRERMADFPIEIECLSRFRGRAEQRDIVKRLADGRIDIIIGTHRLLSDDVRFKNLGLLVIDEEQRFGVAQKERLKRFRATVDVLTLTATPIPRTLHMALAGVRDISVLATPPPAKRAVLTRVCTYDGNLIRKAILRELARGGQVFFVHNRVRTMDRMLSELSRTVPEARIRVGHGQMDERALAATMSDFLERRFDVLLCTTIIESGLDMPNVNTIIINNAHTFGLADLHQLRGRVGRHAAQAFAYFLTPPRRRVSRDARRRLDAIEEFDQLGAGFRLALRDLEIRGAGNLLGREQAGHIFAVGYELYVRLLAEAVAKLRRRPHRRAEPVDVALDVPAFIPDDYIGDMRQRMEQYRKIAEAATVERLEELRAALHDRYGRPPGEVENLFMKAHLGVLARPLSVRLIRRTADDLVLRHSDGRRAAAIVAAFPRAARFVGKDEIRIALPRRLRDASDADILSLALSRLKKCADLVES